MLAYYLEVYADTPQPNTRWCQVYSMEYGYGYILADELIKCDENGNPLVINIQSEDVWIKDGLYSTAFAGGSGSKADPYQISDASQLARLSRLVYDGLEGSTASSTKYYILTKDIDLSAHKWVPIGAEDENKFYGSFDGKGFKISGMRITLPFPYIGLFGIVGFPDSRERLLNNIDVTGSVYLNKQCWAVTNASIGGIAADSMNGYDNCHADLNVQVVLRPACGLIGIGAGGIGMNVYGMGHDITNCSSRGSISFKYETDEKYGDKLPDVEVGGISSWASVMKNCFSVMDLSVQSGLNTYIGGICSFAGTCVNCYYGGRISADSSLTVVGNIMGGHGNPSGTADECFVYNCYWNADFQVANDANHDGIGQAGDFSTNSGTFTGSSNEFKVGQIALEDKLNEWASQDKDKYKLWRKSRINDDYKGLLVNGDWDSWLWYPVFDTGDVTWREIMTGLEKENPWKSLNGATIATKTGNTIVVEGGTIKDGVYIRSKEWPGEFFDYENPSGTYVLKNINTDGFYIWAADGYSYDVRFEDTVSFGTMFSNMIWLRGKSNLKLTIDTSLIYTNPYDPPMRIEIESDAAITIKGNGSISINEPGWHTNDNQLEKSAFSVIIGVFGNSLKERVNSLSKLYQNLMFDKNLVASTVNGLSIPVYIDLKDSNNIYRWVNLGQETEIAIAKNEIELRSQDSSKIRMLLPANISTLWMSLDALEDQSALYHIEARNGNETLHVLPGTGILYFPYPAGTNADSIIKYMVHHYTGHGIIEYSTEDGTIQKTPYGLAIRINELSPFIVEWEAEETVPTPTIEPVAAPTVAPTNVPRTGDNANLGLWIILCLMGLIGMIVFSSEMAKKHKK